MTTAAGGSTSELVPVPSTTPQLPFDIVDHIFSFLKSHPKALLACSRAHPILSEIVERHRFRHVILNVTGATDFTYSFRPSNLLRYLSERPRIVNYVTVLQFELKYHQHLNRMTPFLEEIACRQVLPVFPLLECIILPTQHNEPALSWRDLPPIFRSAVENLFHLPTMREVHLGDMSFPLSILDNHASIDNLSLAGPPETERQCLETAHPQIKSLALQGFEQQSSDIFCIWAKRHITGLQTLKYDFSCDEIILQVFKISSNTLKNLYLYLHRKGTPESAELVDLSSLPHLQHLTVHAEIYFEYDVSGETWRSSYLRIAVEVIKTASSIQQLTIEIHVDPVDASWPHIDEIDFSPLTDLSCPHIDLYIYTGSPRLRFTHAKMGLLLAKHEVLVKSIERGVLVIHPEEAAPAPSTRSYVAKENDRTCIIM